jgi:ABC-type nitrate/sulfonate/bicarbonate transport system ATPase subunit
MSNLVEVAGLSLSYASPAQRVLRDVTFTLKRGERLGVTGPSGCGKTSLLRLLSGIRWAEVGGTIRWAQDVHQPVPLVWQDVRLLPWMRVLDNVALAQAERRGSHARLGPREALALVGAEDLADRWPRELSHGQSQRVALARALCRNHPVLLLDEPFASVDAIGRRALGELLLSVARAQDISYVLVTHDIDEALRLTNRLLVFNGSPATIVAEYSADNGAYASATAAEIWSLLRPVSLI